MKNLPSFEKKICEAVKCDSLADSELNITVNGIGTLRLFLCEKCKRNFEVFRSNIR